jgi:type IV pilus assembly protein PilM
MALSNICWGIEIGAASIKAIKLEKLEEGKVRVLDYAVLEHPKPLSTPGVNANDVLRVTLGALTSQFDLSKAGIAVSVPGHAAFARFTKLPPVEPKKVPDIVKFEAMQQIPFPLDQVEWDYQTFVSPDSPDVGAGIFAITKERVGERLAMLQDVGLTPDVLTLSPLAAYNALAYDLDFAAETPGTIIVDVGTTSTDIVIAEPGRMWVRTFPIGGHQFTEALVAAFQLSYPKAEKLKREAEDSKHARQVFQAMRPVFTDLATEVQRSIGYYQALHKDANLTRLIGIGSTFRLPGLRKYFKQQLSLDVYRIEEFKKLTIGGDREAHFKDAALNLVTAYGLALQGLEMNACGGNLMPVSITKEAMWKSKVKWFATAAGLALAASALMFYRPIVDNFAVKAAPFDPIVQTATNNAKRLTQEAVEAGVVNAPAPDAKVGNTVDLVGHRELYAYIINDVGAMFRFSDQEAAGWPAKVASTDTLDLPAFTLVSLTTDYEPPSSGEATSMGDFGGGPSLPAEIQALPRVRCTLQVNTDAPEARRFASDTIRKWLLNPANQVREGVPYRIYATDPVFTMSEATSTAPTSTSASNEAALAGIKGLPPGFNYNNPGDLERLPEEVRQEILRREGMKRNRGIVIGGSDEGSGVIYMDDPKTTPGTASSTASSTELDALAKLPSPAPAKPMSTATITWYAVIEPPKAAGEGEQGGNK